MPRRGERKAWPFLSEASNPRSMVVLSRAFFEDLRVKNYSEVSVSRYSRLLNRFLQWSYERELLCPGQITKPILERYQHSLFHYRREDGRPLSFRTQHKLIGVVQLFFRWLSKNNYLEKNPAADLELPKLGKRLPRHILTVAEVEKVLSEPDLSTAYGIRDRAILETFYSTGIRRSELVKLAIFDLDFSRGTVMIREGKGKKDRVVPIGERALSWVEKYLREARPALLIPPDDGTLFISYSGGPFSVDYLGIAVRRYLTRAGIEKEGACHIFRHTMATLMLEGGADIRFIQQMLGHSDLSSTEIYTQVSIDKLKQIHTATHPGAKLGGPPGADPGGDQPTADEVSSS